MTATEDAAVLRAADEVLLRRQIDTGGSVTLTVLADRLDPPEPPLPTGYGWHPEVRHRDNPNVLVPGALRDKDNWSVVALNGSRYFYAHGSDAERFLTVAAREPRVLQLGHPCPEVGSRWVDHDGDRFEITGADEFTWGPSTGPNAMVAGTPRDWPGAVAFPAREVLA